MLLHDSRRAARTSPTGDLVLLEDQDRSLWNRDQMRRASLVERALSSRQVGPIYDSGGDRGGARPGAQLGRDGLGSDRRTCMTCCCRPLHRLWSS